MDLSLFVSPRPDVDADTAGRIATDLYGISGQATELGGERDRNFRIAAPEGSFALKICNAADNAEAPTAQLVAMEHALRRDPTLPIPAVRRTIDGALTGSFSRAGATHQVQLVAFIDGVPVPREAPTPELRRSVGRVIARLNRALRGFRHPGLDRDFLWDVTLLPALRDKLEHVEPDRRELIARQLDDFEIEVLPRLGSLPHQTIHGDVHGANLVVDPREPDRIVGLVDFGDISYGPRVLDLAIAAAYQLIGSDPKAALAQVASAYHLVDALDDEELELVPQLAAARLVQSYLISAWRATVDHSNLDYILADQADVWEALAGITPHPSGALYAAIRRACGFARAPATPTPDAVAAREATLGPALSLSYDEPVRLVAGEGVWLEDTDGNRLLDAYNNVPHVGHGHPQVVGAIAAQLRRLTTNTRYLVDEVTEYARRLAASMPKPLSVVMFVNSGSEANDLAYQISRVVSGGRGVVITEHAYHGMTAATATLSPEELGKERLEDWVTYVRGADTLGRPEAGDLVSGELTAAFAELDARGHSPAMIIFDGMFSSDGIFPVPAGYLRAAYATARAAGALCVADEVQSGFGRIGPAFWGFATDGVVPDIVTLGKPMGNGHPMGAVVTTPAIAAEFAANWHFFSTFAGSPVAAAAGMAVLDVLETEALPERAVEVGSLLRSRISALGYGRVKAVRGAGLFTGVELEGATVAGFVVQELRRRGILIGRTGPELNVLKIRPPMVFAPWHVDLLVEQLDSALALYEDLSNRS